MNIKSLLDLEHLRSFVCVAECGSMTKAAKHLCKTTAAVSMQIKKLEELLGQQLFDREGRAIFITPVGERLLSHSIHMLKTNNEILFDINNFNFKKKVRLGIPEQFNNSKLSEVLGEFYKIYPNASVEATVKPSAELMIMFSKGELDITVVCASSETKLVKDYQTLIEEDIVWVRSRLAPQLPSCSLPLAISDRDCSWRLHTLAALERHQIPYHIAYSSDSVRAQLAAVEAGLAISAVPRSLISEQIMEIKSSENLPAIGVVKVALGVHANLNSESNVLVQVIKNSLLPTC